MSSWTCRHNKHMGRQIVQTDVQVDGHTYLHAVGQADIQTAEQTCTSRWTDICNNSWTDSSKITGF